MIGDYKHLRLWSKSYKKVIKFTCTLVLQFIVVDISRVISRFIRIWRHSASPSANRGVMPSHACSETLSVCEEGQAHYTSTAVIYGDTWSIWCRWTKIFCLFSSGETFCHEWLYHGNVDYYLSASWNDCAGYVCVAMCLLSARWCLLSWPGQTILTAGWPGTRTGRTRISWHTTASTGHTMPSSAYTSHSSPVSTKYLFTFWGHEDVNCTSTGVYNYNNSCSALIETCWNDNHFLKTSIFCNDKVCSMTWCDNLSANTTMVMAGNILGFELTATLLIINTTNWTLEPIRTIGLKL